MEEGFVRIPRPSHRIFRGANICKLTPKGEYLLKRHRERVAANPEIGPMMKEMEERMVEGIIGRVDGFSIYVSENI